MWMKKSNHNDLIIKKIFFFLKKETKLKLIVYLQSSPTGPAEHCAGGSLPKSWSS